MIISLKELRLHCQGSISNELDKYPLLFKVIRKFSIYLTWLLIHTPLSPNAITITGIISAYLGLIFLFNNYATLSILFFTYTVLSDFSDGEVSRYKKLQSKEGTYLDKVHHLHTVFIFFAAILLYQYLTSKDLIFLFCSFSILPFSILLPFSITYGIDVAEIIHMRYLISGKRYHLYKIKNYANSKQNRENEKDNKRFRKLLFFIKLLLNLSRYWSFPYIFITYGFAFLLDYFVILNKYNFSEYLTFFYTITFPILTYFYIWRVLKNKIVEKTFHKTVEKRSK